MASFQCDAVLLRDVPHSMCGNALSSQEGYKIDMEKALRQHQNLVELLRDKVGAEVTSLDKDEQLPDCVFVEDVAIAIQGRALITNPGHPSRRPEAQAMEEALRKFPGLEVVRMKDKDPNATMDGGDVLYTGQEIFSGLSSRTNEAGIQVLREFFAPIPVTPVHVGGELHLKSVCSLASPGKVAVFVGQESARKIVQSMKNAAVGKYDFIEVSGEARFANCVYLERGEKSFLVCTPEALKDLECVEGPTKLPVDLSEFAKVDGCITCSVLPLTLR